MADPSIPEEVRRLADARADARASRDWPEADRLRAEIEAAGWRVVDRGFSYRLTPAHAPDIEVGGVTRYGRVSSVPSRAAETAAGVATVVVPVIRGAPDPGPAVDALRAHAQPGVDIVLVADAPSPELDATLEALAAMPVDATPLEVVRTSAPLGYGAVVDIGIRRAAAAIVIVVDPVVRPLGDLVTPLVTALADPSVAIAGADGWRTVDLRRRQPPPPGETDVDLVGTDVMAFRRADAADRAGIDERFVLPVHVDAWWSLALRDGGEDAPARRAVRVSGLPLERAASDASSAAPADAEASRASKRAFYRVLDRFGHRRDLLSGAGGRA